MTHVYNQTDHAKPVNPPYVTDFNKISAIVEARCRVTGETPAVKEIETQLVLRASFVKHTTLTRDLTAIRKVIS